MPDKISEISSLQKYHDSKITRKFIDIFRHGLIRQLAAINRDQIILVEGNQSWSLGSKAGELKATIRVDNPAFYAFLALGGSIGAAQAYMAGYWHADNLVNLFRIIVRHDPGVNRTNRFLSRFQKIRNVLYHRLRRNTLKKSKSNIISHYDLSNDFFSLFLDPTMTYSCGFFKEQDTTMEKASIDKLDRICRKLQLKPGEKVIEIGTGWGSFALHAAQNYGCHVTTTTISEQQYLYVKDLISKEGLSDLIQLLDSDYRELAGKYDKLVSIEMIEAVGYEYISRFMQTCDRLLKPDGLMALQAITIQDRYFNQYCRSADFIQRYIFPGGCLISLGHLFRTAHFKTSLRLLDSEDITPHYIRTLMCWRDEFFNNIQSVRELGYSDEFIRMWEYYLTYCEAGFRERHIGDVQIVFAKPEYRGESISENEEV